MAFGFLCNKISWHVVDSILCPFSVYHALYLEKLTCSELLDKVSDLFNLQKYQILEFYIQGPSSIHILLTDEVSRN